MINGIFNKFKFYIFSNVTIIIISAIIFILFIIIYLINKENFLVNFLLSFATGMLTSIIVVIVSNIINKNKKINDKILYEFEKIENNIKVFNNALDYIYNVDNSNYEALIGKLSIPYDDFIISLFSCRDIIRPENNERIMKIIEEIVYQHKLIKDIKTLKVFVMNISKYIEELETHLSEQELYYNNTKNKLEHNLLII